MRETEATLATAETATATKTRAKVAAKRIVNMVGLLGVSALSMDAL
jgi:hypothetical protein